MRVRHKEGGRRHFKILNHLADHPQFPDIVKESWDSIKIGRGFQKVWWKLVAVKGAMKKLHYRVLGGEGSKKIAIWQSKLEGYQTQLGNSVFCNEI